MPASTTTEVVGHLVAYSGGEAIPQLFLDNVNAPDILVNSLYSLASNGAGKWVVNEGGVSVTANVTAGRNIVSGDKYGLFRNGGTGVVSAKVSSDGGATWVVIHNFTTTNTGQLFIQMAMTNTCGVSNLRGVGLA